MLIARCPDSDNEGVSEFSDPSRPSGTGTGACSVWRVTLRQKTSTLDDFLSDWRSLPGSDRTPYSERGSAVRGLTTGLQSAVINIHLLIYSDLLIKR